MKKMMIAFAAVAMSVVANAATCNWSAAFVPLNTRTASKSTDIKAYLMNSSVVKQADMIAAFSTDDKSAETGWAALLAKADATTSGIAQGSTATRIAYTGFGNYAVGEYTMYTVFIDDTRGAGLPAEDPMRGNEIMYYIVTQEVTANAPASGSLNMSFGNLSTTSWIAPEPTSGLLMLLGLATLALKRKRA